MAAPRHTTSQPNMTNRSRNPLVTQRSGCVMTGTCVGRNMTSEPNTNHQKPRRSHSSNTVGLKSIPGSDRII
jgi:hypothetical protein